MKKLLGLLSVMIATVCYGSNGGPACPTFVTYLSTGIVRIWVPLNTRSGSVPSCATSVSGNYYPLAFNITSDAGKAMLAGILSAHATGEQMWLNGSGDCGVESGTETLVFAETAT